MKSKKLITLILGCLLLSLDTSFAQNFPFGFNYQAVVRDANGSAKTNTTIGVRLSILQGTSTGTLTYQETQTATTNALGQFNLIVGSGTYVTGTAATFSAIAWNADIYFLKSEIQTGVSTYSSIGTQQLMAVPYALNARTSVPTMQIFLSGSGTYTAPVGVSYIEVKMIGGGGGGGNGSGSYQAGGGGSGGGMEFTIVNPLSLYLYSVGPGGASATNGGSTTFGTNTCGGGTGGSLSTLSSAGGGGTINIGSGVVFAGGKGGAGGSGFTLQGTQGGDGIFGGGGGAGSSTNGGVGGPGSSGSVNTGGGGGGGGGGTSGGSTGGTGGSGVIIIKEYYK